jgi:hypothetical protein
VWSSKLFGRKGESVWTYQRLNQNFEEAQFQQKRSNKRKENDAFHL